MARKREIRIELRDRRIGPQRYTVHNVFRGLARRADPWADIDRRARPIAGALDRLQGLRLARR